MIKEVTMARPLKLKQTEKDKRKIVNVSFAQEIYEQLVEICKKYDTNVAIYIRTAVVEKLEKEKAKKEQ